MKSNIQKAFLLVFFLQAAGTAFAMPGPDTGAFGLSAPAAVSSNGGATLYVSPDGSDSGSCGAQAQPCKTIGQAVSNAPTPATNAPANTVIVEQGTYTEQVDITKRLRLVGMNATIDATGLINGILVGSASTQGAGAGSLISGFTVENALGEGILVLNTSHVTVALNTVRNNDLGAGTDVYPECQPQGGVPGDCGEGVHLMNSSNSLLIANDITLNSGGILLTDEGGPTRHNVIINNAVVDNLYDCGITLASHSTSAVGAGGQLQPTQGGIYHNSILNNYVSGNGVDGEGAGVLIAAAAPGGAVYANTIANNHIVGNELSGVTLHSHAPNQFLDGNVIAGNDIGENNLGGDSDAGDTETTGVLLYSAVVPVLNTMIAGNQIADNTYGIWLDENTLTAGILGNLFVSVITQVRRPNTPPPPPGSSGGATLYVSPGGTDSGSCGALVQPCKTIGQAVSNAPTPASNAPASTVIVEQGTYTEQVDITKRIWLLGMNATIDATGLINGILVGSASTQGAGAGSLISGFTVENALGEGILVLNTSQVTVALNTVRNNDLGAGTNVYPECQLQGEVPGDCGEGVHLMNSTNSLLIDDDITLNSGGILLTDEGGPTRHNVIMNNAVADNLYDCGITLASHSTSAVGAGGQLQPTQGGIYQNSILNNLVSGNGVDGEGAGVLLAAAAPGGAVYANTIANNRIVGNELSGVTLHSHAPNQFLDGNVIAGNDIGENNLGGDSDAGDTETTGVLLYSAVVPVLNTMIAGNHIADNAYGIWLDENTLTAGILGNLFVDVATQVRRPNTPPTASDGTLSTNENTAASGTLMATDAEGNPLTFSIVAQPSHGSVTIDDASSGAYTYTPDKGYSGDDSFTFKANDGQADSNIATISVTIKAAASAGGGGGFGPFALVLLALAGLMRLLLRKKRAY